MPQIRQLSEQVANQIAAGEVVDRPAAVVKELVENSLDAGASRIVIEVEGSGVSLIRISDNGCGMDQEDARLCLNRHATSKLRTVDELMDLHTLGFRGEAIPSIASVSWLIVLTRAQGQELGTRVEVRHGVLQDLREAGCPAGTVMEVRQLFANVPARKKFLKSQRTELAHMEETVKNLALLHPECAFLLRVEGRESLNCPAGESGEARLRRICRYQDALITLAGGTDEVYIEGALLLPEKTPATAAKLRLFVNGRAVQDNLLRFAVRDALQGYLMRGFQPAGLIQVHVPPGDVDVNVHPAKREVRFRKAEVVRRQVAASVVEALRVHEEQMRAGLFQTPASSADAAVLEIRESADPSSAPPASLPRSASRPESAPLPPASDPASAFRASVPPPVLSSRTNRDRVSAPFSSVPMQAPRSGDPSMFRASVPPLPAAAQGADENRQFAPLENPSAQALNTGSEYAGLRLIGQFFSLYLLCERAGQLVVIDQHAAHERILYGRLVQQYLAGQAESQVLLFPESVDLEPELHEFLEARQDEVAAFGLLVQPFGGTTWLIQQVPALTSALPAETVLRDLLSCLRLFPTKVGQEVQDGAGRIPQAVVQILSSLACKAAIKAGRRMEAQEMLDLLAQMEASAVFSHCPHGRPVIKTFTAAEVEQWFHRRD